MDWRSARADRPGFDRPCSQSRSVPIEISKTELNSRCDIFRFDLRTRTSMATSRVCTRGLGRDIFLIFGFSTGFEDEDSKSCVFGRLVRGGGTVETGLTFLKTSNVTAEGSGRDASCCSSSGLRILAPYRRAMPSNECPACNVIVRSGTRWRARPVLERVPKRVKH